MGLEIYQQIKTIKETQQKQIYLVYNEIDGLLYIHKILHQYNRQIFEKMKQIKSPHLPYIYEIIEQDSCLHIIEEYINAHTLDYYVLNNELSENQKHEIMNQLCDTVSLLHKEKMIHRDIKPENIFYQRNNVILFDFDISRFHQDHQEKDTRILGSVGYAAPEQFGFKQTDERTDIYAMGVLMNYLYTGKLPNEDLYSGKEKTVIEKAIHIDPNKRYTNIMELKNDLKRYGFSKTIRHDDLSWTIPGFRTGKLRNKIIAVIIYALTFCSVWTMKFDDATTWVIDIYDKTLVLCMAILTIVYATNYRNINEGYVLFYQNKYKIVRILGIVLTWFIAEFLLLLAFALFQGIFLQ